MSPTVPLRGTKPVRIPKSGPEPDEAKEQAISDLLEQIANLPGIPPQDLELLEEITQPLNQTHQ